MSRHDMNVSQIINNTGKTMNRIMRARIADAAEILELQKLAYRSEAAIYDDWSIPPLTQTLHELEKEFDEAIFLKCADNGKVVGSVRASMDGETCEIGRLMVHAEYRRQGMGSRLMWAIENEFPQAKRFELFTGSRSQENIRIYQRLGYTIYRTERLSPKVEIVFMEKWRK